MKILVRTVLTLNNAICERVCIIWIESACLPILVVFSSTMQTVKVEQNESFVILQIRGIGYIKLLRDE